MIDLDRHRTGSDVFRADCKRTLDKHGVLVLPALPATGAILALRDVGTGTHDLLRATRPHDTG